MAPSYSCLRDLLSPNILFKGFMGSQLTTHHSNTPPFSSHNFRDHLSLPLKMLFSRNMLLLVLVTQALLLISMPAHKGEATNMMKKNQVLDSLQAQVPPISLPVPNSPTTGDTRISEKAFASDLPLLRRELLKGYTRQSAPSPETYIPASTNTLANHNAAPAPSPLPGSCWHLHHLAPMSFVHPFFSLLL